MMKQPKCNRIYFLKNQDCFSLHNFCKRKSTHRFLKGLCCLSFSILFLVVNCKKEETYPIPSFCAAEADWGPNNIIVFANEPWMIIPPETVFPNDPRPWGLWTVKSDGSELKFLVGTTPDGRDFGLCPEWSPDGNWIVANDRIGRIWMVSADGDSFVQITQGEMKWYPSFSPDGKKIAFSTPDSDHIGQRGIRIFDLANNSEKFVFAYGYSPSWSPDGSQLVFNGYLKQNNQWYAGVIVCDTSGMNARMVCEVDNAPNEKAASFSPDGAKIVFHQKTKKDASNQIWVVNTDESNPRKLTRKGGAWPSWSPDGSKIVYTKISLNDLTQEGNGDLYIINPDGSDEKRLTFFYLR